MTEQMRKALVRLLEIREQQDSLQKEKMKLAEQVGLGTHRLKEFPGKLIIVQRAGWSSYISWSSVARKLARQYGLSESKLKRIAENYRSRTRRNQCVVFRIDRVKNPKILPI